MKIKKIDIPNRKPLGDKIINYLTKRNDYAFDCKHIAKAMNCALNITRAKLYELNKNNYILRTRVLNDKGTRMLYVYYSKK